MTNILTAASLFDVLPTDKSVDFLGIIFGKAGSFFSNSDTLMGQIFQIFSSAMIVLGLGLVIFNVIISITSTSSEGEPMGEKWSSVWVPARTLMGLIFLLPTEQGYAKIQIFVLWLVFNCIGAANSLWNIVLTSYEEGVSINQPAPPPSQEVSLLMQQIFTSIVCTQYLNTQVPDAEYPVGWSPVQIYLQGSSVVFGLPTENNFPICGSLKIRDFTAFAAAYHQTVSDPAAIENAQTQDSMTIENTLLSPANDALTLIPSYWDTSQNVFDTASQTFTALMHNLAERNNSVSAMLATAREDGWILAGSYYYKLVSAQKAQNFANILPIYSGPNIAGYGRFANGGELQGAITALASDYINTIQKATKNDQNTVAAQMTAHLQLSPSNINGSAMAGWDASFGQIKNVIVAFTQYLTTNQKDPIASLANVGTNIMIGVETIWVILLGVILTLNLAAYIGLMFQGAGPILSGFFKLIAPAIAAILLILWTSGVTMGIYLPLVPYLVFTIATITWFFEILEAVVCAPLVALMLIFPSEDEWGHGAHAFGIYLGVLLRPALMVIGFVAGTKMLTIAIQIINYGFGATVISQLTGVGIFSSIVILVIYVGLVIALTHESFSLIYELPEKVLRWIGEHGLAGHSAKLLDEAHRASEQGGEKTEAAAKATYAKVNSMGSQGGGNSGKATLSN